MAGLTVHFEVLNQLNTPTLYADTLVNRPTPSIVGRIFFRTDSPFGIYRDTGTSWDLIANPDTTGISGSGVAGQVPYFTGGTTIGGTNNLFWDSANNRLGIGTATPGVPLDVHGTGTQLQLNGTGTNNSFLVFQNAGVGEWRIGNNYSGATNYFSIFDQTNSGEIVKIQSGTTATNGIYTLNAASFNNYTLTGIAAATTINNNRFISNYTFDAGITRTTIADIGTSVNANMTFSGAFTKSNDGQQSGLSANLTFTLSGNHTQNQPATYTQTPTSIQSGATFSGAFTVSHFSNTRLAPWISATPTTITNAYQLVINNLSAFSVSSLSPTFTNRWAIYQDGASDNNYFAGKIVIGTTTVSTYALDTNGTARFTGNTNVEGNLNISKSGSNPRLEIQQATNGATNKASAVFITPTGLGYGEVTKFTGTTTALKIIAASDFAIYNSSSSGDISILNDFATGKIKFASGGSSTYNWQIESTGQLTANDAINIAFQTTTGSKIGTANTQKIGFWNATPIVQPTTATASATFVVNAGTAINTLSTFDGYKIDQVVKALRNAGILA